MADGRTAGNCGYDCVRLYQRIIAPTTCVLVDGRKDISKFCLSAHHKTCAKSRLCSTIQLNEPMYLYQRCFTSLKAGSTVGLLGVAASLIDERDGA